MIANVATRSTGKMALRLAASALVGAIGFVTTPDASQAQGLFDRIAGKNCSRYEQEGGVFFQGFFRGSKPSPFISVDGLYVETEYRCFRSLQHCDAWLYEQQSSHTTTGRTWCRQYGG